MKNEQQKPRGVATVMAVAIMGLVAACIAALMTSASIEFKSTSMNHDGIQLQQYHLAAIAIAQDQLKQGKPVSGPLALPEWAPTSSIKWNNDSTCEITIGNSGWTHEFAKSGSGFVLVK